MGCCLSGGNRRHEAENRRSIDGEAATSPRGILDVETVKEVLLEETPLEKIKAMPPENQEWKPELRPPPLIPGKDGGETESEVTEISEVCSYSESLSTSAAPEKSGDADDDGVVDQRPPPRKRRAHGGGRGRGERVVVAGRLAAEKRGRVAPLRPVRGRAVAAQPRNGAEENGNGRRRRDLTEGSGKRSRSPASREEVATPTVAPLPRNESDQKIPAAANGVVLAGEAESLENPVVSLECFIFL